MKLRNFLVCCIQIGPCFYQVLHSPSLLPPRLGNANDSKGDYDQAIEYYQKALKIQISALGENHPDTKRTQRNLAKAISAQANLQTGISYVYYNIFIVWVYSNYRLLL